MKERIAAHVAKDGTSAWRLRMALEMEAYCTRCNKAERDKRERRIALYESLTENDKPNFQITIPEL